MIVPLKRWLYQNREPFYERAVKEKVLPEPPKVLDG